MQRVNLNDFVDNVYQRFDTTREAGIIAALFGTAEWANKSFPLYMDEEFLSEAIPEVYMFLNEMQRRRGSAKIWDLFADLTPTGIVVGHINQKMIALARFGILSSDSPLLLEVIQDTKYGGIVQRPNGETFVQRNDGGKGGSIIGALSPAWWDVVYRLNDLHGYHVQVDRA